MSFPDHQDRAVEQRAVDQLDDQPLAQACMLRVVSGIHAGAVRRVEERAMVLVGSGDDCDIVLSDRGVAPHHALVSMIDGVPSVRALDASVKVQGRVLQPGDPMSLHGVQRVTLGDAVIALGAEGDAVWSEVLPGYVPPAAATSRLRRLPVAAAIAAIALASVAIYVAANPQLQRDPDPSTRLASLATEYHVDDSRVAKDPEGVAVLYGTVDSAAERDRLQRRVEQLDLNARIDVRTGEDIARDVSEVLRTQHVSARTRYLGNGDVEALGRFEDMDALRAAVLSRSMAEVVGVKRVYPRNLAETMAGATAGKVAAAKVEKKEPVRLIGIVRGKDPYVMGSDGSRFQVGSELPDGTILVAIGERAHGLKDGVLQLVKTNASREGIASDVSIGASTVAVGIVAGTNRTAPTLAAPVQANELAPRPAGPAQQG